MEAKNINQNTYGSFSSISCYFKQPPDINYYWKFLIIIGCYYVLPSLQFVFYQSKELNNSTCYYNNKCKRDLYFIPAFNNIISNILYVLFGLGFIIVVRLTSKDPANNIEFPINNNPALYYSLGISLFFEGVCSAVFHICPSVLNFQFDTTFMFIGTMLTFITIYQKRHMAPQPMKIYSFSAFLILVNTIPLNGLSNGFEIWFWGGIFFLISYLLLPTFYNQSDIVKELKNGLQSKFDLNFKFSQNIKYNFFPRPHFITTDSKILDNKKEIAEISKLKIFISFDNLFSIKDIEIRDMILENANFNLNTKNYNFFIELLNRDFQGGNITINNSNVFFKHIEDEVLFITKIFKMKYYFDSKELKNIFYSENEIFNIPFSVESFFSEDNKKNLSTINLDLMKLNIENELIFENNKKIGKSKLNLNKIKRLVDYKIEKNSFDFHIFDKIDQPDVTYKGKFNFKPFYANLEGNSDEINLNYLFSSNAILAQLLKTEILNNKNIDFKLNINADSIYNNNNFKNIDLNLKIQEGLIDTDKTKFEWRNLADFELIESLIFVKNGELVLDGKLKINIRDYKNVYKFLLTPKNFRNQINQIDLNFTYNFDQKIAELRDIKIDNKINQNVNKILSDVIFKKDDLQNKIYFKNLLNEAIKSYAG